MDCVQFSVVSFRFSVLVFTFTFIHVLVCSTYCILCPALLFPYLMSGTNISSQKGRSCLFSFFFDVCCLNMLPCSALLCSALFCSVLFRSVPFCSPLLFYFIILTFYYYLTVFLLSCFLFLGQWFIIILCVCLLVKCNVLFLSFFLSFSRSTRHNKVSSCWAVCACVLVCVVGVWCEGFQCWFGYHTWKLFSILIWTKHIRSNNGIMRLVYSSTA